MADAAAARREARRRKILGNSESRLQIISGKATCEVNHSVPVIPVSNEQLGELSDNGESSYPSVSSYSNGVIFTSGETAGVSLLNNAYDAGDNEVVSAFLAPLLTQSSTIKVDEERPISSPLLEQLVANKFDVVILSLLLQLLYSFFTTFDDVLFFLPLATYAVMKSIWFPSKPNSTFANILLLLNGLSTTRVQRLIQIAQVVGVFTQDVCVFLFTTIFIQALFTRNT